MLRAFISSTRTDLESHRREVITSLKNQFFEVEAMEDFGPDTSPPLEVCYERIKKSDIFIGIYAYSYGSVYETGVSFTELEYIYAKEMQKEMRCYLHDDNHEWLPNLHEKSEKNRIKLKRFLGNLKKHHTIDNFTAPADLALKVVTNLNRYRLARINPDTTISANFPDENRQEEALLQKILQHILRK